MSESYTNIHDFETGYTLDESDLRTSLEADIWSDLGLGAFRKDVAAELRSEPGLDASGIAVSVRDGRATLTGHIITLTGEVEWQFQKVVAERAARRLSGVVELVNMIKVRSHPLAEDAA